MTFSRHEFAIAALIIGAIMVGVAVWMERRREHQLMPSLIPPTPIMLLGGTIALIAIVILLLPNR